MENRNSAIPRHRSENRQEPVSLPVIRKGPSNLERTPIISKTNNVPNFAATIEKKALNFDNTSGADDYSDGTNFATPNLMI